MIPVLILAAGQSSRMQGRDKLLEDVGGQPLLRRQVERAQAIGPVYVALPNENHPRQAALFGTSAVPIAVPESTEGMGGTMRGAVSRLPPGDFMLLLGDLISIETNDLQAIMQARTDAPDNVIWRGATPDGRAGHPIIFHHSLRPMFQTLRGDDGGKALVNPLKAQTHLVRFDDDRARRDLDTPKDWADWRSST